MRVSQPDPDEWRENQKIAERDQRRTQANQAALLVVQHLRRNQMLGWVRVSDLVDKVDTGLALRALTKALRSRPKLFVYSDKHTQSVGAPTGPEGPVPMICLHPDLGGHGAIKDGLSPQERMRKNKRVAEMLARNMSGATKGVRG